jgi:hypothetical protein
LCFGARHARTLSLPHVPFPTFPFPPFRPAPLPCKHRLPRVSLLSPPTPFPRLPYAQIFSLPELPRALTVIGGGPIGCELSQAYARLGSSVTLVAPRLLPMLDEEAGEAMRKVRAGRREEEREAQCRSYRGHPRTQGEGSIPHPAPTHPNLPHAKKASAGLGAGLPAAPYMDPRLQSPLPALSGAGQGEAIAPSLSHVELG